MSRRPGISAENGFPVGCWPAANGMVARAVTAMVGKTRNLRCRTGTSARAQQIIIEDQPRQKDRALLYTTINGAEGSSRWMSSGSEVAIR